MQYKKWTEDDFQTLRELSEEGFTAREVAEFLQCSEDTVKKYKSKLKISTAANKAHKSATPVKKGGSNGGGRPKKYTKEQLIEIMKAAPVHTYSYFNSKESGLPAATTYREYFGSWEAALEAAGLPTNSYSMKPDRTTYVYLIDFGDFYKIGITQQRLKDRFGARYPKYEVVVLLETSLEQAKTIEKEWLQAVKALAFIPENFPIEGRGGTECFKY